MKKKARYFLIACCAILLIMAILVLRPVPIVSESEALTVKGTVVRVYSNQGNDVVFMLKDDHRRFYINRGLENGLELDRLKQNLMGNPVVVKYPKYWTPLDWNNTIRHISKIEYKGEVLFNELKK